MKRNKRYVYPFQKYMFSCSIFISIVYSTEPQNKKKKNEDNQRDTSQPQKLQSNMQTTHQTQLHNTLNKKREKTHCNYIMVSFYHISINHLQFS